MESSAYCSSHCLIPSSMQGNRLFKAGRFREALECYSRSLALGPTSVAYANRAMAALKLEMFREAEVDCTAAIDLDDHYVKAYSRRGRARSHLGKWLEAADGEKKKSRRAKSFMFMLDIWLPVF